MNPFVSIFRGCVEDPMQAVYICLMIYGVYLICRGICPNREGNNI